MLKSKQPKKCDYWIKLNKIFTEVKLNFFFDIL